MEESKILQIKVSELTGNDLDYWAMKILQFEFKKISSNCTAREGTYTYWLHHVFGSLQVWRSPSTDWSMGGPIIHEKRINLLAPNKREKNYFWSAYKSNSEARRINGKNIATETIITELGDTPLVAAMRCFVQSEYMLFLAEKHKEER